MAGDNTFASFFRKHWMTVLIAAQPVLDILAFWTQSETGTAAGMIRLLCMAFLCLYAAFRCRSARFYIAMSVIALVFGLHLLNGFRVSGGSLFMADLKYVLKVAYMPVMAVCFCTLFRKEDKNAADRQVLTGMLISALLEVLVLIVSGLTDTYTRTYIVEELGTSGWVIDSNRCCQSDILSTLSVFLMYYSVRTEKPWLRFGIPVILVAVLITNATTACYLTLLAVTAGFPVFILFRSFVMKKRLDRQTRFLTGEMAGLFALSVLIYPLTPRAKMEEIEKNSYSDNEQRFVQEMADLGYDIYALSLEEKLSDPVVHEHLTVYYIRFIASTVNSLREKYDVDRVIRALHGTVSAEVLGDTRNMKRLNARFIFEDSDSLTHLLGFSFGNFRYDYEDLENDWIAIWYYYGYIGFACYVLAAALLFARILRLLLSSFMEHITLWNFTLLMCFVLQLGLAWFSGAMLRRPNASIYFSIVVSLIWIATIMKQPGGEKLEAQYHCPGL